MKTFVQLLLLNIIFVLTGCYNSQPVRQSSPPLHSEYIIHYAKGFTVERFDSYTKISVRNPWDTTRMLQTYILVDRQKDLPKDLPKGTIVRTPLEDIATYSTIHCSTLNELNQINIIKGVCEPEYIKIDFIQQGVTDGSIENLGMASKPDTEKIIMLNPDAIMATPIQGWTYGSIEKTGIPIIETIDYTEPHPLGRAEWIRFYSLFTNTEHLADSLFRITEKNYNNIKEVVSKAKNHPTVLLDLRYQGKWNTPGGQSFMAKMLADAGASYRWADNKSAINMPLNFETVLDKAGDSDIWLVKYNWPVDMTYTTLKKEYTPYSNFKAFKTKNVYACNTAYSSYYEDLPIHPDYILKDMAYVFHPELFQDYTPKYYKKVKD